MVHDLFQQAYAAMRHNRRRTALTLVGMAWGIATVVLLLSYGAGFGRAIHNIFANFGVQVMGIFPGRSSLQAGGVKAGTQTRFTLDDLAHIQDAVPLIHRITPEAGLEATVQYENRSFNFHVGGFYSQIQYIRVLDVDSGRFFTADDEAQRARVAVIGSEAKDKLFSGGLGLGGSIGIKGLGFELIAWFAPKMQEGDDNITKIISIPYSPAGNRKTLIILTESGSATKGQSTRRSKATFAP